MEYRILYEQDKHILKQIADIHYETLHHLSFLTLFGHKFLFHLYNRVLHSQLGFFAVALKKNEVMGFAFLCFDSSKLLPAIFVNPFPFIFFSAQTILKQPMIIIKILKTFSYFGNSESQINKIKAEYLAMAVKKGVQSQGIGTSLIRIFEAEYKKRGIKEYKFGITQDNPRSVQLFRRLGFHVAQTFDFSGSIWNIYVKKII